MSEIPFGTIIKKSIARTKLILIQPFQLKKWLLLLCIAWLSGSLGGGGNFNLPDLSRGRDKEAAAGKEQLRPAGQQNYFGQLVGKEAEAQEAGQAQTIQAEVSVKVVEPQELQEGQSPRTTQQGAGRSLTRRERNQEKFSEWFEKKFGKDAKKVAVTAIVVIAVLILAISFFFSWLSCRFKFIWLNAIIKNDASVKKPFAEYRSEGNSLFKFYIVFGLAGILFFGLLVYWGWSNGMSLGLFDKNTPVNIFAIIKALILPVLCLITGIVVLALTGYFIEHFVVAVMGIERCGFAAAWRRAVELFRGRWLPLALFFLLCIGLGILIGIIVMIAGIILGLLMLLAGALVFGVPYLLIATTLKLKALFFLYALVAGVPALAVVIIAFTSLGLPFSVFYRCFSLYFLSALGYERSPLRLEETPAQ